MNKEEALVLAVIIIALVVIGWCAFHIIGIW